MRNVILILFFVAKLCGQQISTSLSYSVQLPQVKTKHPAVLILLHGYGSNEADLLPLAKQIAPVMLSFSLRAPNSTGRGGFCWYQLEFLADQKFKYDYNEALKSKQQILEFISKACKAYQADSTKVYLIGFSQGAIMSYELALSAPAKIKGVMALSGRMMPETAQLKTDEQKLKQVRFFIAHGFSDTVIKEADGRAAYTFLQRFKLPRLVYKTYNMPHTISQDELNDLRLWLNGY